jgi:sugar phosphate isomerase/epimerase
LTDKLLAVGVPRVQLALDPWRESPQIWTGAETLLRQRGITIVSGMIGCVGEDYATLESIRATGGIAPDATWEDNLQNFRAGAALARHLSLKLVTFHTGFLPPDDSHPAFAKMLLRLREIADLFSAHGLSLGLETGQETAPELAGWLRRLNHPALAVNFDPANMIMYDKGGPVQALQTLAPWIRQAHLKDARRPDAPGTWGREVPVGAGDVDWPAFFAALRRLPLEIDLAIERESGVQRLDDIRAARTLVEQTSA